MHIKPMIAAVLLPLCLQACSPVKGYPGPDRPDTDISIIESKSTDNVTLSQEQIGGIAMGSSGIAVLPGHQEFSCRADLAEKPFNCRPYTEFNSSGLYDCEEERRKKNKYNDCDCYDYLSVYEACDQVVKEGGCRASFKTEAGKRYEVTVGMYMGAPVVKVLEAGTFKELGSGKCDKDGYRTDSVTNYIGYGRSVAQRAGFYSCRGY
jgi:hypothetical protein